MNNRFVVRSGLYFVIGTRNITTDKEKARWYDYRQAKKVKTEMNRRTNPKMVWTVERA